MGEEADRGTEVKDGGAMLGEAELVDADFAAAAKLLLPSYPKWIWAVIAVGFVVLMNVSGPSSSNVLTMVFPAIFVVVLAVSFRTLGSKHWVKRATADLGGTTTFRFDDFGVATTSKVRQVRCAWSTLTRYVEGPHAFYVYPSPTSVLIVPKRAFVADELGEIRALLSQRVVVKPLSLLSPQSRHRLLLLWVVVMIAFFSIWRFLAHEAPQRPAKRSIGRLPPSAQSYGGDGDDDTDDE